MPGEINTFVPLRRRPANSLDGNYTAGDKKTEHIGSKKVDVSSDRWQAGFDRIDIAHMDGILSTEEICDYRDKQVTISKILFWINPMNWFNIKNITEFYGEIGNIERETESYRK